MQTPTRGNDSASDDVWVKNETDGTYSFTLTHDMEGTWTISASCTVGETTYSVSCYSERVKAEEVDISGDDVKDVAAINAKLADVINNNSKAVQYCVVNLEGKEYEGTIEIPKETTGRVIVILQGKRDRQGNRTILNGGIIIGISLFLLFITLGIPQGYTTVVLSHITFCLPYVILSVMPRLKQMNPNLYEAALDLGASPMQALRKVIIPEILPGMISGFMLAITMSIDDFAVTIFTIGNEGLETLSTFIYADARKGGLTPELRPLSTIIFVLVLVMLIIINRRSDKNKKK